MHPVYISGSVQTKSKPTKQDKQENAQAKSKPIKQEIKAVYMAYK
jgi:hypothetical protein